MERSQKAEIELREDISEEFGIDVPIHREEIVLSDEDLQHIKDMDQYKKFD